MAFSSVRARCGALAAVAAGSLAATSYPDGLAMGLARVDGRCRQALAATLPHGAFVWLYSASRAPFLSLLSRGIGKGPDEFPSPCTVMGLRFRRDLGNAAGLDKDAVLLDFNYDVGAGFAVVGTVLDSPHTGNLFGLLGGLWKCNVWTPLPGCGAALNSLGLPSHGVRRAVENIRDFRERRGVAVQTGDDPRTVGTCFPIGVSIMGHPRQEGQEKLDGVLHCVRQALPVADFLEVNESCPNVAHGHDDGGLASRLRAIAAVRDESERRVPILVKLGSLGDPETTVRLLAECGMDGLVLVNTQRDYEAFRLPEGDRALLEYYTASYGGGLSGPPILERSLGQAEAAVAAVRRLGLDLAVVHCGGLATASDVGRSRQTGAPLRQWYTGLFGALTEGRPHDAYKRVA